MTANAAATGGPAPLSSIEKAILAQAQANGVDPRLALAVAQQESGLNPTAVGDQGTSYGLYQLHQGGELGNLSPAQAFNPNTNAAVALSVLGRVIKANPSITDPGVLAAMAQRPSNPQAYAASVDAIYGNPSNFSQVPPNATPAELAGINWSSVGTAVGATIGGPVGAALGGAAGGAASFFTGGWQKDVFTIVLEGVFVAGALALILMGLTRLFPGAVSGVRSALPLAAL